MANRPAWLKETSLQQLFAATQAMGGEARAVGGAVRDFLLGRDGGDVDVASSLPPEATMAIAQAEGWKAIPTGLAHGTVTLVLPERVVEITTLRRDVETDGRHALVEYTSDFAEDAARRDFTINALYMDAAGGIHDYTDGQKDLKTQRVRFIGDAGTRIAEDALRILRFFRFMATHGKPPADADALAACAAAREQIANLSGERIAAEMRKLLCAPTPAYALAQMAEAGIPAMITESPWVPVQVEILLQLETLYHLAVNPWVRLLAMIEPGMRSETAYWVSERWKLSRAEQQMLQALAQHATRVDPARVKEWLRSEPRGQVLGRIALAALNSDDAVATDALMLLAQDWEVPGFPVTAKDLLTRGYEQGRALGEALAALEKRWVESDYQLTREQLLA